MNRGGMQVDSLELPARSVDENDAPLDLAEVYRRYSATVMGWASRLSGRPQEARDLTQEIFCVVQRRLRWFRPRTATVETWLFHITHNVVRTHRRRQRLYAFFFGERKLPDVGDARPSAPELLRQ